MVGELVTSVFTGLVTHRAVSLVVHIVVHSLRMWLLTSLSIWLSVLLRIRLLYSSSMWLSTRYSCDLFVIVANAVIHASVKFGLTSRSALVAARDSWRVTRDGFEEDPEYGDDGGLISITNPRNTDEIRAVQRLFQPPSFWGVWVKVHCFEDIVILTVSDFSSSIGKNVLRTACAYHS